VQADFVISPEPVVISLLSVESGDRFCIAAGSRAASADYRDADCRRELARHRRKENIVDGPPKEDDQLLEPLETDLGMD
jgi:hypothetical protein